MAGSIADQDKPSHAGYCMNNDAKVMHDELFSRGGLSLDRLRTLCKVAEHGSIAKAAEGDPVRQSQFSRQLRDLGQFFDVELTRRRGKGAELTPAGRELAALGREIMEALNGFRLEQQADGKTMRIGAGESLIQWHLLPRIGRLQAELPGVVIALKNLRGQEVLNQLVESQLDFGLVAGREMPSGVGCSKLGLLRYRLYAHAALKARLAEKDWREVMKLPLVGLEGDGDHMRNIKKVASEQGITLRPAVLCSSQPGVAAALKEIRGFAILPVSAATDDFVGLDAPFLREFDRTIHLVWGKRRLTVKDGMSRWRRKLTSVLSW